MKGTQVLKNYQPTRHKLVIYKLFTRVITVHISDELNSGEPREQTGLCSGFSATDHIHTLIQIREITYK